MKYTITTICVGDPAGPRQAIETVKRREDMALLALQWAVWRAADAQGLRDTRAATLAMKRVNGWTKRHPIEPIRLGSYVISIKTEI